MTGARRAIARRAAGDAWVRTASFAMIFALIAVIQVIGYRHSFPTLADRVAFARGFGDEKTVRLFYGTPHDLLTTGGYVAWRVGGIASILAAAWGLVAAVAALRGDEEAGRQELVLAGLVTRRGNALAALAAVGASAIAIGLALLAGLVAGGLAAGPSAYLVLATLSPAAVFAAVGAVTSQLVPSRRLALEIGAGVLLVALTLRVVADTASGLGALRWLTPLGWTEEMRAFAGPRPVVLILPALATTALVALALALLARRDIGAGLLRVRDSAPADPRLLSSPTAQALRSERGSLLAWALGIACFAAVVGLLAQTFTAARIPGPLAEQLQKVGVSVVTPSGALGLYFLFFVLAISLFACAQVAAARREEADGRLETLLALPVGRRGWLAGRLLLAAAAAVALALTAGLVAWAAAVSQGTDVSAVRMLEAGANCLPAALLFLGAGALAFAALPRAAAGIAYGVVGLTFLWELAGALVGAPGWTLRLSPFHNVGLVPAQAFQAGAAVTMLAIGALCAVAAVAAFGRRDLASG